MRAIVTQHTAWHGYNRFWFSGEVAPSPELVQPAAPSFAMTTDEPELHLWLIEDIYLRIKHAAVTWKRQPSASRLPLKNVLLGVIPLIIADAKRFLRHARPRNTMPAKPWPPMISAKSSSAAGRSRSSSWTVWMPC